MSRVAALALASSTRGPPISLLLGGAWPPSAHHRSHPQKEAASPLQRPPFIVALARRFPLSTNPAFRSRKVKVEAKRKRCNKSLQTKAWSSREQHIIGVCTLRFKAVRQGELSSTAAADPRLTPVGCLSLIRPLTVGEAVVFAMLARCSQAN